MNIKLSLSKNEKWPIIQAYSPAESDKKEDVAKIEKLYEDLQSSRYYKFPEKHHVNGALQ